MNEAIPTFTMWQTSNVLHSYAVSWWSGFKSFIVQGGGFF